MALSNHDRVGKALDLLNRGLMPFVERESRADHADRWLNSAREGLRDDSGVDFHRDSQAIPSVMWSQWNSVFKRSLGHAGAGLVSIQLRPPLAGRPLMRISSRSIWCLPAS